MITKDTLIAVAMSGGVDSSVAAALLKEQGYNVMGLSMKTTPCEMEEERTERYNSCCSLRHLQDARYVAHRLGIPYQLLDFHKEFQTLVIDDFLDQYNRGRTPSPCVVCNEKVKFDLFFRRVREFGAEYVATGHYAKVEYNPKSGRYILRRPKDLNRDQTYFLYGLTQEQLSRAIFPLADYTKSEVREIARKIGLKVADKPDSQELCFVTDKDYRDFLAKRASDHIKPGPIVDRAGNVLGEHRGIQFYTIGQRKGLGIALGKPKYVIALNAETNSVVVGDNEDLFSKSLRVQNANFISIPTLTEPMSVIVKIRHVHAGSKATIVPGSQDREVEVIFDEPQRAITPGQSAVFYDGDIVVGGGVIT